MEQAGVALRIRSIRWSVDQCSLEIVLADDDVRHISRPNLANVSVTENAVVERVGNVKTRWIRCVVNRDTATVAEVSGKVAV